MCLKFWCCFGPGLGQEEDYCGTHHHAVPPAKATATPHHHHHQQPPAQRGGGGGAHYHHRANGHDLAPPQQQRHLPPLPVTAEEGRKASNDLKRGGHANAASAAYVYSGPRGTTVTQPAGNATVAVADDHYPTTAATYNLHR